MIINGKEFREVTLRGRTKLIARDGEAYNPIHRKQKCTIHYNPDGYPCFGGGVPIHLYVAHGWVEGYFEGAEVNHKDFDRTNYDADNLEWITHRENVQKSVQDNREVWCKSKKGENNGRATFTEEQVREIRTMYDSGSSIADIVRYYHPELQTQEQYHNIHSKFAKICHRETWKHIE